MKKTKKEKERLKRQYAYNTAYQREHYSRLNLFLSNGLKQAIDEHAVALGIKTTDYVKNLIISDLEYSEPISGTDSEPDSNTTNNSA